MSIEDRCGHIGDDFENRLEYCELEAIKSEEGICKIIDVTDDILVGTKSLQSEEEIASTGERVVRKSFSYIEGRAENWEQSAIETRITIRRSKSEYEPRDDYEIMVQWRSMRQDAESRAMQDGFFTIRYDITVFEGESVQGEIFEPDIKVGNKGAIEVGAAESLLMTPYDCERLLDELKEFRGHVYSEVSEAHDEQRSTRPVGDDDR